MLNLILTSDQEIDAAVAAFVKVGRQLGVVSQNFGGCQLEVWRKVCSDINLTWFLVQHLFN